MDAPVDVLVARPIDLNGAFALRTPSGDVDTVSLCGLSNERDPRFVKTYGALKQYLIMNNYESVVLEPYEAGDPREGRLESVLASLSDEQFQVFARILLCSSRSRHLKYLGICSMVPQELEEWQRNRAHPTLQQGTPNAPAANSDETPQAHVQSQNNVYISFSINDVEGASELAMKIALNMKENGLVPNALFNVELLQRFASLSETVSRQLTLRWMGKWPVTWAGIDEVTLDLREAHGPDGEYLATKEWLEGLSRLRRPTSRMVTILAPTAELRREAYVAFNMVPLVV